MDSVVEILERIGLPYAYHHFAPANAPVPPFICYLEEASNNFAADGVVYLPVTTTHIEVYTDRKNPALEERVEEELQGAGVFWDKEETYIPDEDLYVVVYHFDVKGKTHGTNNG